jgi:hypothetical protein
MELDLTKLENVRECGDAKRARCPACAASGHDKKGEHLMVFANGLFGCGARNGDHEHRRLIWKLAGGATGSKTPVRPVREQISRGCRSVSSNLLGRFGRVIPEPPRAMSGVGNPAPVCECVPNTRPTRPSTITAAPYAPPALVPLDVPFKEGQRYRPAGATELRTRLDLYVADPAGPWVRTYGVLMAVPPAP